MSITVGVNIHFSLGSLSIDMTTNPAFEHTPDGRKIVVGRELSVGRDIAWNLLRNTQQWTEWGPSVRAVECNQQFIDVDTTGRVQTVGGLWLPFEITSCMSYRWHWRVMKLPATGHRVDQPSTGSPREGCRVIFELPILAAWYIPVCSRALDRIESILL